MCKFFPESIRILCVSCVASVCLFHSSCLTMHQLTGWSTEGEAHVSYPQVFKRERLLIDRWREYEFLRKKLDAPIADTRQAYHDLRILSEIFTQISGQIKPRDLIAFEQEIQVTRAKIQLQELQNDLQKVNRGESLSGSFAAQVTISGTLAKKGDASTKLGNRRIHFSGSDLIDSVAEQSKDDGVFSTNLRLRGTRANVHATIDKQGEETSDLSFDFIITVTSGNQVTASVEAKCNQVEAGCVAATASASIYPSGNLANDDRAKAVSSLEDMANKIKAYLEKIEIPQPQALVRSEAQLSPIDRLNDERTYRAAVLSAMNENQLDDSHDIFGSTLYTLELKASLTPGQYSTNLADIELQVEPDEAEAGDFLDLYDKWLDQFKASVSAAEYRLWQRLMDPAMKETRRKFCQEVGSRDVTGDLKLLLGPQVAYSPSTAPCPNPDDEIQWRSLDQKAVREVVLTRYTPLKGVFVLSKDLVIEEAEKKLTVCRVPILGENSQVRRRVSVFPLKPLGADATVASLLDNLNEEDKTRLRNLKPNEKPIDAPVVCATTNKVFYEAISKIERDFKPRVVGVQPREYAQNISDVSARDAVRAMMIGIKASLKQGADMDAALATLDRSQERTQAILRQPLISSYGSGESRFGWVIGPRFRIGSDGRAEFIHAPVTHSVTFSLMVPAWKRSIRMHAKRYWIDAQGSRNCGSAAWDNGSNPDVIESKWYHYVFFPFFAFKAGAKHVLDRGLTCIGGFDDEPVAVNLPADMTALTTALLFSSGLTRQLPDIEEPQRAFLLQGLEPGSTRREYSQSLFIAGQELWRNPEVFLGNRRADKVDIAPDMKGIVATFTDLEYPGESHEDVDLTVVTSVGKDALRGKVKIQKHTGSVAEHDSPIGETRIPGNYCTTQCTFRAPIKNKAALVGTTLKLRLSPAPDGSPSKVFEADPLNAADDSVSFSVSGIVAPRVVTAQVLWQQKEWPAVKPLGLPSNFLLVQSESETSFTIKDTTLKWAEGSGKEESLTGQIKLTYLPAVLQFTHPQVDPRKLKIVVRGKEIPVHAGPVKNGERSIYVTGPEILQALGSLKGSVDSPLEINVPGFEIFGDDVKISK